MCCPPLRSESQLLSDALAIWSAGVRAVQGHHLISQQIRCDGRTLEIPEHDLEIDLRPIRRITVLGGGKAGRSMAVGLEQILGPYADRFHLSGQLNVPAELESRGWELESPGTVASSWLDLRGELQFRSQDHPTRWIALDEVRPPGQNLVTPLAVEKTQAILERASRMEERDLCIVLLSGGGSALLSSPPPEIGWETKNQVTQWLSQRGAPIEHLNQVRGALSQIKSGGLLRRCGAGTVLTLVLSDVLGDPPPIIASGPTWLPTTHQLEQKTMALAQLDRYDPHRELPGRIYDYLSHLTDLSPDVRPSQAVHHYCVLGNLAVAVDAAGVVAERLGYSHSMHIQRALPPSSPALQHPSPGHAPPTADQEGQHLARMLHQMRRQPGPDCLITGGEPVVHLGDAPRDSLGGRNQQLALAAICESLKTTSDGTRGICLVAGGTDGEDGPTAAAGACLLPSMNLPQGHNAQQYRDLNDAFHFFQQHGGLLLSGGTGTNVCDLRVGVVDRIQPQPGRDR